MDEKWPLPGGGWTTIRVHVNSRDRLARFRDELTEAWRADQPRARSATLDDAIGEALDAYALWNGKEASR